MIELIFIILGLLLVGHYKRDFTTLFFSGFGFIFYGLMTLNKGILEYPYSLQFGYLCIGYGIYVALRASIALITYKKKEVKDNGTNKDTRERSVSS